MSTRVDKAWGYEEIQFNGALCCKVLHIKPGWQCSLHWHETKDELFVVLEGECFIQTSMVENSPEKPRLIGEVVHIPPGLPHRFKSLTGAKLLEASTHHDDADVVRLEQSRKI